MMENESRNDTARNVLGWTAGLLALILVAYFTVRYQSSTELDRAVIDRLNSHEVRITSTETCLKYMSNDISEIKEMTKEIRNEQKRRERQGR
jgi:hypothetical protein